eukprot:Gb_18329 [translate_table: standard]
MGSCRMPHAVLVAFPAQGHINPMMQLAKKLASDGFLVTFVNNEYNHSRIIEARKKMKFPVDQDMIRLTSICDGFPPEDTRTDMPKLLRAMENTMGLSVEKLIQKINDTEEHMVTCLIADMSVCYVLEVAKQFNIPRAVFNPALIGTCAVCYSCLSLVSSGILPSNGILKEHKMMKYLPSLPPFYSGYLPWLFGSEADQEYIFQLMIRTMKITRQTEWVLFNSFYELEAPVIKDFSKEVGVCTIGPLIPCDILDGNSEKEIGINPSFWADEVECLDWLDKKASQSVIYVSFGSLAVLNERQFEELALGLEATHRPFLWVVRSDLLDGTTAVFPSGFAERIKDRGCLVSWAPQLSVLSHSSIACFLTHCGWNSTLESISMGVPMICWPYFADQFLDRTYIVEVWKIGLALNANKDGIIDRGEIEEAVKSLLVEEEGVEMKKRVMKLKESGRDAVKEGGSSSINYNSFLNAMKKH